MLSTQVTRVQLLLSFLMYMEPCSTCHLYNACMHEGLRGRLSLRMGIIVEQLWMYRMGCRANTRRHGSTSEPSMLYRGLQRDQSTGPDVTQLDT
jgi:hypothetical protein